MSDPSAIHPTLDGRPVMIGDHLEATCPDDPWLDLQFHVGTIHYDSSTYPNETDPAGWTVSPIDSERAITSYEWPISECRRVTGGEA